MNRDRTLGDDCEDLYPGIHSLQRDPISRVEELEISLQNSLSQLDSMFTASEHDFKWFETLIHETKLRERSRLRRDLALFWCAAVIILAGWWMSIIQTATVFLVILLIASIGSLLASPIIVWITMRQHRETSA
ncbi:MAG: YxlC family protein [Bacilli bacterium]